MVQEVFNEHKLPEEFAGKVLEGVPEIKYQTGESTLCGSIVACMEYIKAPVPYWLVSATSGASFKLLWHRTWCPSNNSMGILGSEPIRRAFWALGYEYEGHWIDSGATEEILRKKIKDSIDRDRPVIAGGIVGPPDEGVVAGYEQNGQVLLGRSYFYDGAKGYYRKEKWFEKCCGIIVVGDKTQQPSTHEILTETLKWAIQLIRTPDSAQLPTADAGRVTGLAAYDVWAEALLKDEDFPEGNLKTLTLRCNVSTSVTLSGLREAREMAAKFLSEFADVEPAADDELQAAAKLYEQEVGILCEAQSKAPFCFAPEKERLKMADRSLRKFLADHILQAKEKDQQAVEHLERALEELQI